MDRPAPVDGSDGGGRPAVVAQRDAELGSPADGVIDLMESFPLGDHLDNCLHSPIPFDEG
jgi:hypothetical protein